MANTNAAAGSSAAKTKSPGKTPAKRQTKKAKLIELLSADAPISLDKLSSSLGWQRHTTSAAMTRLRQDGHNMISSKADGGPRSYQISAQKVEATGNANPDQAKTGQKTT